MSFFSTLPVRNASSVWLNMNPTWQKFRGSAIASCNQIYISCRANTTKEEYLGDWFSQTCLRFSDISLHQYNFKSLSNETSVPLKDGYSHAEISSCWSHALVWIIHIPFFYIIFFIFIFFTISMETIFMCDVCCNISTSYNFLLANSWGDFPLFCF